MVCRDAKQSVVDVRESPSTECEGIQRKEPRGASGRVQQHSEKTDFLDTASILFVFICRLQELVCCDQCRECLFSHWISRVVLWSLPHPPTLIPQLKSPRTNHCHQIEHLQDESGILRCKYEQTAGKYQTQNANMMIRGHLRK